MGAGSFNRRGVTKSWRGGSCADHLEAPANRRTLADFEGGDGRQPRAIEPDYPTTTSRSLSDAGTRALAQHTSKL